MIDAELEARLAEVHALASQALEIASQHGAEHGIDSSDPGAGIRQIKDTAGAPTHPAPAGTRCHVTPDIQDYINSDGATGWTLLETGGAGAPKGAKYLVEVANADLTDETVVGTAPGGELGGTWVAPTVDETHSGTPHHVATPAHHDESHAVVSHADTTATGDELETLTDGSDADALHNHPADLTPAEHTAVGDGAPHHSELHGHAGNLTPGEHLGIGDASPHHAKYTDAEARTAVPYVTEISFGWDPQSPQIFAP